jgi:hypothetical protein
MIPIVREFFRGLKERDELDAIIPELLTTMGYEVLSRPMVGTRQYGSDVAAIGTDDDGQRKLFLFSIKRGDLNRREWDGDADQALRQSLNEIRDAYLAGVAPAHRGLPVVAVITIGGIVLENTLPMVNGYMAAETKPGLEFRLWTGDTLTARVVEGAMREEVFPEALRTLLRRAAALVEEPEAAVSQFARLLSRVADDDGQDAITRVRTLYLALWILTVWGREAANLEAPYRASELVVLRCWELLWPAIEADDGRKLEASHALHEVILLHLRIWDELYRDKVLPHADSLHALSFAVWSHESVDVNLAMFETAGRVAMGGLWRLWLSQPVGTVPDAIDEPPADLQSIVDGLAHMVRSNPALLTPVTEFQGVDLSLALILLASNAGTREEAATWVQETSRATRLAHARRRDYPVRTADYESLISDETPDDDAWRDATAASIIQPILAAFAWGLSKREIATEIDEFQKSELQHCNFQTWVVNAGTDAKLWRGGELTGSSRGGLTIGPEGTELIETLKREVSENTAHAALSAIRLDHWPILLLACRVHRLPPPPQLWLPLLDGLAASGPAKLKHGRSKTAARPATVGGIALALRQAKSTSSYRILMREELQAAEPKP